MCARTPTKSDLSQETRNTHTCIYTCTCILFGLTIDYQLARVRRIWYLSPMRAAKVQASLSICAVLPEPPLLAHTSSESRGTFRQKARSLAPLNGWACAVKICHDGMLEDTNSLDGAQLVLVNWLMITCIFHHQFIRKYQNKGHKKTTFKELRILLLFSCIIPKYDVHTSNSLQDIRQI